MSRVLDVLPPRQLQTLERKPSWHNRAGRIDRSACAFVNASWLWRRADFKSSPTSAGRLARGTYEITAADFDWLMRFVKPHNVQGDYRTTKSNAMRGRYVATPHRPGANPNHGATREKMLGLPADWCQALIIERWQFPKHERKSPVAVAYARKGHIAARRQHFLICPTCRRKCTKLFLPQCTADEYGDARAAQDYLRRRQQHCPNRPGTSFEAQLIERYGILFDHRVLQCRLCLGIRYGEIRAH
jgi:hypothetical protein